ETSIPTHDRCKAAYVFRETTIFVSIYFSFFFNDTPTPEIYTLSLHDALPIWRPPRQRRQGLSPGTRCSRRVPGESPRSEEHTSELQSLTNLVCRLLLEKK